MYDDNGYNVGVTPCDVIAPEMNPLDIYKGVISFVLLQILGLMIVFFFSDMTTWLPAVAYGN